MKKYVEYSKKDDPKIVNEWYSFCKKENIPYITINSRIKYSTVEYDYITSRLKLDDLKSKFTNDFYENAINIYNKYKNNISKYDPRGLLIRFENLNIDKSRLAANELYDLIRNIFENKENEK